MKTKPGLSGSTLKWIAIAAMVIDHMGAGILEAYVLNAWGGSPLGGMFLQKWDEILAVDRVLRYIGRPSFPIFCFLLVQGFLPELPELQHRLLPHFPRLNRYRCFLRVLPEPVQGFPERFREPPRFRRP